MESTENTPPADERRDMLSTYKLYSLIEIGKKINSLLDINMLLSMIMESCKTLLDAEASSLMLADDERQVLTFHVISGDGDELKTTEVPIGVGIAGTVAQTGEPLLVNDAQNDPRLYREADKKTNMVTRNLICVPMIANERVIGVLEAMNTIDREGFDNDDLLLMMALAEQASISIMNNKLYERIRARVDELSALHEVSQLAMYYEKTEDMLRESLEVVARIMHCRYSSLLLYNSRDHTLMMHASTGFENAVPPAEGDPSAEDEISLQVFLKRSALFSENIAFDPRFNSKKNFRYTARSFISMPLQTKSHPIGVLNVTDRVDGGAFDSHDVRILQTIASQISDVHENILLHEEKKNAIRLEKELEITRRLQEAILPKSFPEIKRVNIFASNKPANEVGGDFYDFYQSPEYPNEFIASIADVSGKSIPAALFMASARSTLHAQIVHRQTRSPARLFESANDLILADSDSAMFVTSFMLHCDLGKQQITYSNAGHNSPLLLRRGEERCTYLHTAGKPLAVVPGARYTDAVLDIKDGDTIIMYTDGLIEANDKAGEEFGVERFEEAALVSRDFSAKDISGYILQSVDTFAFGVPQFDDITLFIIKFNFN